MKYKAGLIGCGRIGCGFDDNPSSYVKTHAGAYSKSKRITFYALADVDSKKLKKYGKKYNISHLYSDYKEMLKEESLDIISICTHADTHLDIVKEAVKNNIKGIFLEKPIANNLKNALNIEKLCKQHGVKLLIDHQRRFISIYERIRDYIKSGKLGRIQRVNLVYGSGIANTGSHVFDTLLLFFGPAKSIRCKFSEIKSSNPHDPNVDGEILFKNGIVCTLNSLDLGNYGILEMDVFGTYGRIRIDMSKHSVKYFVISSKLHLVYKELELTKFPFVNKEKEPILTGLNNLVDSLEHNSKLKSTSSDGYKALELITGAILSALKHCTISLPVRKHNLTIHSK